VRPKFNPGFGGREMIIGPRICGVTLGEIKREAPAQAELRPTCAGAYGVSPRFNPGLGSIAVRGTYQG
jgi:hypothetical protein